MTNNNDLKREIVDPGATTAKATYNATNRDPMGGGDKCPECGGDLNWKAEGLAGTPAHMVGRCSKCGKVYEG